MRVRRCDGLKGEVRVSGAKNAALPLLAASLLVERFELENFPVLLDTLYALRILELLGREVELLPGRVSVKGGISSVRIPYEISSLFRGSLLFLGGLLGAVGRAEVAHPGGCAIGSRPIDQHLKFLSHIGAEVELEGGFVKVKLPPEPKARAFTFDLITVTGTENALLTLAGLRGEFELHNAALEPEVLDLVEFLKKLGLEVEVKGRSFLVRSPGRENLKREVSHRTIPDRIEAGTFLVAGALLGEPLTVKGLEVSHLGAVLEKLREAGAEPEVLSPSEVRIRRVERPRALEVQTAPYPGFPTDMQAQFMAMLTLADGVSLIVENIFENRFQHALELARLGASVEVRGKTAIVRGVERLKGAPVNATDLRASAALVLAGLVAEGETVVGKIGHLLRGYEDLDGKLRRLGCDAELF
ncbi:MAG: UDP-N-acetylglucosamine 1-carboxyvinyltransferase [Aquificae bacterium]|nr:UDP-N-acetylglucosamine 1-carboxyvinyltransferase [Aquificota bacterium]